MTACKIVQCPKTGDAAGAFFRDELGPLLEKHWHEEYERTGVPHGLDVPSFLAAWEQGGIMVIMAYDNDEAVGFMIAFKYRPLWIRSAVLTVERWYADTPDTSASLFAFLSAVTPAMGVSQVHAATHANQTLPDNISVDKSDSYIMERLDI